MLSAIFISRPAAVFSIVLSHAAFAAFTPAVIISFKAYAVFLSLNLFAPNVSKRICINHIASRLNVCAMYCCDHLRILDIQYFRDCSCGHTVFLKHRSHTAVKEYYFTVLHHTVCSSPYTASISMGDTRSRYSQIRPSFLFSHSS